MKNVKNKNVPSTGQDETFEVTLRLLQDDENWGLKSLESAKILLNLLQEIDKEHVLKKPEKEEKNATKSLLKLQNWLKNHNKVSGDSSDNHHWQLSNENTESTGLNSDYKGNRVIALNDIEEGKIIMNINRTALFSAKFGSAPCPEIAKIINEFSDNVTLELTMLLLYHRNIKNSFFKIYLNSLPTYFTVPLYWDINVYEALDNCLIMKRAIGSLRSSAILYLRCLQTVKKVNLSEFPINYMTWDNFRWALSVVMTRQNNVPLPKEQILLLRPNESEFFPALVPGWDMLNHELGEVTTYFDVELDAIVYPSMRAFVVGSEITMCYGFRPNDLLLIYSGFCIENNPNESLDAELSVPRDEISRVRDLIIKTFLGENLRCKTDGNLMYTVDRKNKGIIPLSAIFASICSVMTREETKIILKIKSVNTTTIEELFMNIDKEICDVDIMTKNKNGIETSTQILNDEKNKKIEKDNNENLNIDSLQCRSINYLLESLLNQKKNLQISINILINQEDDLRNENENENCDDKFHVDSIPIPLHYRRSIITNCKTLIRGQISIINDSIVNLKEVILPLISQNRDLMK
jgi:hypothetical protein